jgi:hypothetical protein
VHPDNLRSQKFNNSFLFAVFLAHKVGYMNPITKISSAKENKEIVSFLVIIDPIILAILI